MLIMQAKAVRERKAENQYLRDQLASNSLGLTSMPAGRGGGTRARRQTGGRLADSASLHGLSDEFSIKVLRVIPLVDERRILPTHQTCYT
jgi:hypothetical protein